jgi:cytidylate kinase
VAKNTIIIAVDGPAASGKGTLSRRLANYYNLGYLDTGVLYRGVGWLALSRNLDPRDPAQAETAAREFHLDLIADADIRTPDVGRAASLVAVQPAVRAILLDYQRNYALHPPGKFRGAVLDGRDIGTVVCPDALVKFYISAAPEVRAERRWRELSQRDASIGYEATLDDIRRRDARDAGREAAPMRPAQDAEFIDTSTLDADAVFARACRYVDQALARAGQSQPA